MGTFTNDVTFFWAIFRKKEEEERKKRKKKKRGKEIKRV